MRGFLRLTAAAMAVCAGTAGGALAQDPGAPPIMINGKAWVYDAAAAADIMRACAACHSETGIGGGGGYYPRLAGLNSEYLAEQLRNFKSRKRENIPMLPYATERELPEADVLNISRYLSEQTLETKPPAGLPPDGYARLQAMKKVLQIPHVAGNLQAGKAMYVKDCGPCHGQWGEGRLRKPALVSQHIRYLSAQIDQFLDGKRPHDDVEKIMRPRQEAEWANLWAYVTTLQDGPGAPEDTIAPAASRKPAEPAGPVDYELDK